MNKALLLIDIQKDYFQGGRNSLLNSDKAAETAEKVLNKFREKNLPIFHVQHINTREGASFFLPDTEGIEFHELVKPKENESVIIKHTPDAFAGTELERNLKALDVNQLVVCGMMSQMCIDTTVRSAKGRGYEIQLVHDACAAMDLEFQGSKIGTETVQNVFMASLQGLFAELVPTDTIEI